MHDIDRTQTKLDSELEFGELESQFGNEFETDRELEYGQELEFGQELEQQEYGQELEAGQELEYGQEMEFAQELQRETQSELEGVFSEAEEMELASELLGVASEAELDMFLGKLLKRAWRGVSKVGSTLGRIAKPLGGILRGVAKAALPMAGGAIGTLFGGPLGTTIGSKLGSTLGNALEMELEGMQQEDREFEVARRIVQVAGTAATQAANVPSRANPHDAARAAVLGAIRRHAPSAGATAYAGVRGRSGRWIRRGNKIVLLGL